MSRSEIFDYQAGREARMKGVPRDRRKNVDYLRGWDDVQDDYTLAAADRATTNAAAAVDRLRAERDKALADLREAKATLAATEAAALNMMSDLDIARALLSRLEGER